MATARVSKHSKYGSSNPINGMLVSGFFSKITELLNMIQFNKMLDVGCGEGHVLSALKPVIEGKDIYAVDFDPAEVADAVGNVPFAKIEVGSVYDLQFPDNFAELVTCTEVLEHLEDPEKALKALKRVTSRYALLSVPREPMWRAMNMARGAYIKDLGNTPGHLNHWGKEDFLKFVSSEFKILEVRNPIPWTIVLAEKIS